MPQVVCGCPARQASIKRMSNHVPPLAVTYHNLYQGHRQLAYYLTKSSIMHILQGRCASNGLPGHDEPFSMCVGTVT